MTKTTKTVQTHSQTMVFIDGEAVDPATLDDDLLAQVADSIRETFLEVIRRRKQKLD